MKKLFLILAAAVFMVACTPKSQPVTTEAEEMVVVDDAIPTEEIIMEESAPATKPAVKQTGTKAEEKTKAEEPKVEEPKAEEPKAEEPKTEEPTTPTKKGRR
jgi:uncharacterized protein YcfL